MTGKSTNDSDRIPILPDGISVFEPEGGDCLVLRTQDGTYAMEPERARDLARLLLARTERYVDTGKDRREKSENTE